MADERGRVRGGLRMVSMDGVKLTQSSGGMTVEAERQCAKDSKEWRALAHMYLIEFFTQPFLLGPIFLTSLIRSGGLSPGEEWDAVT